MVAVGCFNGLRTRLDSSLVAKWPDPIDLASDIFIPGKTAAFKSQLMAALQSRDLWSVIASTDPTAITIAEQNPDATPPVMQDWAGPADLGQRVQIGAGRRPEARCRRASVDSR